jgi:hypothetical protein
MVRSVNRGYANAAARAVSNAEPVFVSAGDLIFLKLGHHGGVIFTHVVKPFSTPHFSVRREQQTGC